MSQQNAQNAAFYAVSVGPGDPELLTVKALRAIAACPVIAAPQTRDGRMLALEITRGAADLAGKTILPLAFSMSRDPAVRQTAHREAADRVCAHLAAGQSVAMLNLGDASVYATASYLAALVQAAGYPVQVVPGVTSFCAAAARLGEPLVSDEETLHVLPGGQAAEALAWPGTKVLMKSGRQLPEVLAQLRDVGRLDKAALVCNCGLPGEAIYPNLAENAPAEDGGYFATLLLRE